MKKTLLYSALLLATMFAYTGCSDDDDDELVGNWKKASDFEGVARSAAVTFTIGETTYVGTGYDGKNYLNDFWEYNASKGTWTQVASMGERGRNHATAFATSSAGYVGLGYNGDDNANLGDFWRYNPTSNSWTEVAPFGGSARRMAAAFGVSGKGYVGTGYDGNFLKDFWCYDPSSDTWTQVTSIGGSKRIGAMTFVIDGKGYVVGGENNSSLVEDFWAYDASVDEWSEKRKITDYSDDSYDDDYTSIMRSFAACFVIDGKAYLACGDRLGSIVNNTWEYNPGTDRWTERTEFEKSGRFETIGFSANGKGYVTTGRNHSNNRFDDMHELSPKDKYNEYD
ncbi:galactose oxidase [Alistipes sp. OttesenSCG-928-B03]|nr:galactose oxidase [Alistipes sp. OttesenSCG-928-B03]